MKLYFAILQYLHLRIGSLIHRNFEKCHALVEAGNISAAKAELVRLQEQHGVNYINCMRLEYLIQRLELKREETNHG